jgi:hypothetical protein
MASAAAHASAKPAGLASRLSRRLMTAAAAHQATGRAAASAMSARQPAATDMAIVPPAAEADRGDVHCQAVASWASMATPKVSNAASAQHRVATPA